MRAFLWLLLVTSFALGVLAQQMYYSRNWPQGIWWKILLFVTGWFVGTSLWWLIIGKVGIQELIVALLAGLLHGYVMMKWMPARYRASAAEAERNRLRRKANEHTP